MILGTKYFFNQIYSIELDKDLYLKAKKLFRKYDNIHILQGDSSKVLPKLLDQIKKPCLFWLDAHYSGGSTERGRTDTPIMEELKTVFKNNNSVILIDDLRVFGVDPAYPTLKEMEKYANGAGFRMGVDGDTIIMTSKNIPQSDSCQIKGLGKILQDEFKSLAGVFVDVGANDGYYCSNTWGLALNDWQGLCFEPVKELFDKCVAEYEDNPAVTVVNQAVGNVDGIVTLYQNGNAAINKETAVAGAWGYSYDLNDTIKVPCTTLNSALKKYKIPKDFEVLSIGVEGAEMEVLDGIDFKVWKPRMVIIEACKDHPVKSFHIHTEAIEERMTKEGFEEIYHDQINSIYVR